MLMLVTTFALTHLNAKVSHSRRMEEFAGSKTFSKVIQNSRDKFAKLLDSKMSIKAFKKVPV